MTFSTQQVLLKSFFFKNFYFFFLTYFIFRIKNRVPSIGCCPALSCGFWKIETEPTTCSPFFIYTSKTSGQHQQPTALQHNPVWSRRFLSPCQRRSCRSFLPPTAWPPALKTSKISSLIFYHTFSLSLVHVWPEALSHQIS